ncbi:hypothetical protein LINPERHAP1_LOCUS20447 [Linum perenne]
MNSWICVKLGMIQFVYDQRFRCIATINGVDSQQHWCYRSCPHCSYAAAPNGQDFWCPTHDALPSCDTIYRFLFNFVSFTLTYSNHHLLMSLISLSPRYRLKLFVSDSTTKAEFVLLGQTADKILPITATELIRAYPDDYGDLPPPIKILLKQTVTFEVMLPRNFHANAYGDFKVSKIWGLKIPRAQLISDLPKPPLPCSPSPPVRGDTPLPPDPRYVPPVYSMTQPSDVISDPSVQTSASIPQASSPTFSDSVVQPFSDNPTPQSIQKDRIATVVPPPVGKAQPKTPSKTKKQLTSRITCAKSPLNAATIPMHLASPSTPSKLLDNIPLRFLARGKRLPKASFAPLTPNALNSNDAQSAFPPSSGAQTSTSRLSASPLARVKREKLDATINAVTSMDDSGVGGQSSSSDDDQHSLQAMARTLCLTTIFIADVAGRLVSITQPLGDDPSKQNFRIILDDPSCAKFDTTLFSLAEFVSAEHKRPVICVVTSIYVSNRNDENNVWYLDSTPSSRIIVAPFVAQFRHYFDRFALLWFSHIHLPIQLIQTSPEYSFQYIRGPLPMKVTLSHLTGEIPIMPPEANELAWCLIRIQCIDMSMVEIENEDEFPRYASVVRCADASTTLDLLFNNISSTLLFKLRAYEYADMSSCDKRRLLASLRNQFLVVDVRSLGQISLDAPNFVVSNLWSSLAAYF